MPVGRIEYLYLGPMTFKEFLEGLGKENLSQYLSAYSFRDKLPLPIHEELLKLFKIYLVIGGMPEAVQTYKDTNSFLEVDRVKNLFFSPTEMTFLNTVALEKKYSTKGIPNVTASVGKKSSI